MTITDVSVFSMSHEKCLTIEGQIRPGKVEAVSWALVKNIDLGYCIWFKPLIVICHKQASLSL